ncbi:MAG TPA: glycosidase [Galbitalea sp.]|nr:glycosidase [Galbitalea sp.]
MTSLPAPSTSIPYAMRRIGVVMERDPSRPDEAEGVLNPASAWASDGKLYLFPRLVAEGNYSRIGRVEVLIEEGMPIGVGRRGIALGPARSWERGTGHGGVEDPRITFIESLDTYVMTYVAFGPLGPRPAIALSKNALDWHRRGPLQFGYEDGLGTDLNLFPNKDVVFFPEPVFDSRGRRSYAVLHRPMWDFSFVRPGEAPELPIGVVDSRPSIWISYIDADEAERDISALTRPRAHGVLATPSFEWEALKIGAGPPPVRVPEGWLLIHHGVSGTIVGDPFTTQQNVNYSAGAMILDAEDPSHVIARSSTPMLMPESPLETNGIVPNVVFPTSIETIAGLRYVFYGMADSSIGVASLDRVTDASHPGFVPQVAEVIR